MDDSNEIVLHSMLGCVFHNIKGMAEGSKEVVFEGVDASGRNRSFVMKHHQSCCEVVDINDVIGDEEDLLEAPILMAEESTSRDNPKSPLLDLDGEEYEGMEDSFTWTFYRFATIKGTVVLRWYGSSSGWYSEEVTIEEIGNEE